MLDNTFSELQINAMYDWTNYWVFAISILFLLFEGFRLLTQRKMSWNILGDSVTNFITLYAYLGIAYLFYGTVYIAGFYYVYQNWSITQLPVTVWTILACIILADVTYYWEHRAMHRIAIGWATHTVHHSSPYFNISVAYRRLRSHYL